MRGFFSALHIIRTPVIISLAVAYFLAVPDQTIEIYRAIAQDITIKIAAVDKYRELVICGLGLLAMGLSIWAVTRILTRQVPYYVSIDSRAGRGMLACAPVALFLLIVLSAAMGVYRAQTPPLSDAGKEAAKLAYREARDLDENTPPILLEVVDTMISEVFNSNSVLLSGAVLVAGAGVLIAALLAIFQALSNPSDARETYFRGSRSKWLLIIAFFASFAAVMIWPVYGPQLVGPVGVFSIFIVLLVFLAGLLSFYADKFGLPLISGLLVYALVLSIFNTNDNHKILVEPVRSDVTAGAPATLDDQFALWFKSRQDRDRYEEKNLPYPIYVVAAPGGGIYAAFHAASQLGSLQDHCPFFSHHTFAISGVSGGSVGAAVFSSFLDITANRAMSNVSPGACVDRDWRPAKQLGTLSIVDLSDRVLSKDFLSPLFAGLLFPDFLQRFLPIPIGAFDRARRFDFTLEQGVEDVLRNPKIVGEENTQAGNLLTKPYIDHWKPEGSAPALIINTTEVDTGRRRIISPFLFGLSKGLRFMPVWPEGEGESRNALSSGMPLSTAVGLSARFPWISPAGWFHDVERDPITERVIQQSMENKENPSKVRLVDGAYFENSGVATALDLIKAMEETAGQHGFADKIQINLIALTRDIEYGRSQTGLNEATAPVRALLNARTARGPITIGHAEDSLNREDMAQSPGSVNRPLRLRKIKLKDMGYRTPLGWRLSTISLYLIRAQNGKRGECSAGKRFEQLNPKRFDGDCVYDAVARELEGDLPEYRNRRSTTGTP